MRRPEALIAALLFIWSPLFSKQNVAPRPPQADASAAPIVSNRRGPMLSQDLTKLTTRASLVLVPVIVTDRSGHHVPGLQKERFHIEENGNDRSVSVFEELKTGKLAPRRKPGAFEDYSNFVVEDDHPWRRTAILLDMINTPSLRQLEAKRQLTHYLLRNASQDEPMAVFGLNGSGLHELHAFTTDTKVLVDALQKLRLSLSSDESTQLPEQLTDDPSEQQQASEEAQLMSNFMQEQDDAVSADYQRIAAVQTLSAMTQLANAFQAYPGRKTLIWATAGFPFVIDDPKSFGHQGDDLLGKYEETWRTLNSANIAIYPVDLSASDVSTRALPSANAQTASSHIADIRGINGLKPALRMPYDESSQQRLTQHAFADATGGQACATVSELEKCFSEAVDDSRAYYLLGYYLGSDVKPGWRKLKVKVAGDGLHVRSRSGFYVSTEPQESDALRRKQFVDALASPVQYSGLRLTARLLRSSTILASTAGVKDKRHAEFMLGVMGDSITIDREKGNAVDLEIIALAFDSNRKSVATSSQAIAAKLNSEMMKKTLQSALGVPEEFDLPPGKYEVKFAVRDNLNGLLGTVSVPVELK